MVSICAVIIFYEHKEYDAKKADEPFYGIDFYDSVRDVAIKPYYSNADGKYYLFLPSYTEREDLIVRHGRSATVRFSYAGSEPDDDIAGLPLAEDIIAELSFENTRTEATFTILSCENLPAVFLETESGSREHIDLAKENSEGVSIIVADASGNIVHSGAARISGRGNGTWTGIKKPYNLSFSNAVSFGDFNTVSKLCLFSEYSDESKMRNAIAYNAAIAQDLPYASPYMYCDLYINGEYMGLYGITTKDEYRRHIDADGIKAVFEISSGDADFLSELWYKIDVTYGETDVVRDAVGRFEAALLDRDWTLCDSIIDRDSFARKYAFEEYVANFDLTYGSQYFYIDGNDVIHCMLPWDYDWTLGSSVTYFNECVAREILAYVSPEFWYSRLLAWSDFTDSVARTLANDYADDYAAEMSAFAWKIAEETEASRDCDAVRWRGLPRYSEYDIRSGFSGTREFAEWFENYFYERGRFLTDYFSNPEKYARVEFSMHGRYPHFNMCISRGENLREHTENCSMVRDIESYAGFEGWFVCDEAGRPVGDTCSLSDVGAVNENMKLAALIVSPSEGEAADMLAEQPEIFPAGEARHLSLPQKLFGKFMHNRALCAVLCVFAILLAALLIREVKNVSGKNTGRR